jgi:hypothetical protein
VNREVKDGMLFDLRRWSSTAVGNDSNHAFDVGNQVTPPRDVCVVGGVVKGAIPLEWGWSATHSFGGEGYRTTASGLTAVDGARIHNVEDGWKPRESQTPKDVGTYPNTGTFRMRDTYMTGIRDDCIEDDEFVPGEVEDSLFDGVWTFLSEQNQTRNDPQTIGPSEDASIRVTRVYVRLFVTNGSEAGGGKWFKWQGRGARNHSLVITDSVFAVHKKPRLGWQSLDIPPGTIWKGTNHILWLGTPGEYGGPRPPEVTYVEGQAAKDKWNQVRSAWLKAHCFEPRPTDDWNPMDDPVTAPKCR